MTVKCLAFFVLQYTCNVTCFNTVATKYETRTGSGQCTVLNPLTVNDKGMITQYAVDNILKSAVVEGADVVISSVFSMQASQTMARPISDAKQSNKGAFSDISYINRNSIISLTDTNNTVWKDSSYSITFKISGCINNYINANCRWTSPIACSLQSDTVLGVATEFPEKQKLKCYPVLLEWHTNVTSNSTVNSTSRIHDMSKKFGTYDLTDYIGSDSYATNAASVVGDFVGTTKQIVYKFKSKKIEAKVVPAIKECTNIHMLSPIETQNLGNAQLVCYNANSFVTAYALNLGALIGSSDVGYTLLYQTDCSHIDAYVSFSTSTPTVILNAVVRYPPIRSPRIHKTIWRPILRLTVGTNYIQDLITLGFPSLSVVYILSTYTACVQACGVENFNGSEERSDVYYCDMFCYIAYIEGFSSAIGPAQVLNTTVACDVLKSAENILPTQTFVRIYSNSYAQNFTYKTANAYCSAFNTVAAETLAIADVLSYSFESSVIDRITQPSADIISINPELLRNSAAGGSKICTESANQSWANQYTSYYDTFPQPSGGLTGFGCAIHNHDFNNTLASNVLSITNRNYTDHLSENNNLLSSSVIVSQWLLLLQNVVLSVIASVGLLSIGELTSRLDNLLYTLVFYYSKIAKKVNSVNIVILVFLWTIVLSMVIVTNAASIANIVVTMIRLNHVTEYTVYKTEQIQTNTGVILVESVQMGNYSTKLWPGYVIACLYIIALLLLTARAVFVMFSVNWKKRVEWLHNSSFNGHKTNIIIHNT